VTEEQAINVLHEMQRRYPHMEIWFGGLPEGGHVWLARGRNGASPWLVMSADLDRFWRWLAA
jgi:hypothetical protein